MQIGILSLLLSCAAFPCVLNAASPERDEPQSVAGLRFRAEAADVLLSWPSAPRESFVVLWRSNAVPNARWITLTNNLRASTGSDTRFYDIAAVSRAGVTNGVFGELYRVFVIPDFWFNMDGVKLDGGPKQEGEDFLPFYYGGKENGVLKPRVSLIVDGQDIGLDQAVERVNFGTLKSPRWAWASGCWFEHDTLRNGEHVLQLTATRALNLFVGDDTQSITLTNAPVHVWVTNGQPSIITRQATGETKGSEGLLKKKASQRDNWWCRRLGCEFVRTRPSPEEYMRKAASNDDPLEQRTKPRPLD